MAFDVLDFEASLCREGFPALICKAGKLVFTIFETPPLPPQPMVSGAITRITRRNNLVKDGEDIVVLSRMGFANFNRYRLKLSNLKLLCILMLAMGVRVWFASQGNMAFAFCRGTTIKY